MAPKRLDAVDVSAALDEFVAAVIDPKVRYRYRAGIPWRDLPERLGDFRVIHLRHSRWSKKQGAQAIGRSRGDLSSRIHASVDALGKPTGFHLMAGQAPDLQGADALLPQLQIHTGYCRQGL